MRGAVMDKNQIVFSQGTHTCQVGNATVVVEVPSDISLQDFTRIFAPLMVNKAERQVIA